MANANLLEVENLNISFYKDAIEKQIIKNISFQIKPDEIVAVVGESGSGKSISSLALIGLLPKGISKIKSGSILLTAIILFNFQITTSKRSEEMRLP